MTKVPKNEYESWPFPDPRIAGVREHFQRVQLFLSLAGKCADPADKFRVLLAGVYSARAVVELIFGAADKGELTRTREELKTHFAENIPWYALIEKIRLHDFHRFGLVLPDPRFSVMMQMGPIKLRAQKGVAIYRVPASGPQKLTTGNSNIKEQRALLSNDGQFFDDVSGQYVSLERILKDFINGAVGTIEGFERDLRTHKPPM